MRTRNFMIMAAAALMLAACSNDNEMDNWNGEIRLISGLEVQQTRATSDIQSSQFASGEKMDVFIKENNPTSGKETTYDQPLVYTASGDGTMEPATQPYFPTSGNGVNIYAYYPSGTVTDITATNLAFSVKEDQSSDANYKQSDLMYGAPASNPVSRTKSATTLTFKHLLSKVTITLVSGEGTPSLRDAIVRLKTVKPTAALNPSTGEITSALGENKDIILKSKTVSLLTGSAVVVPQTLGTSFIEIELANGGKLTSKDLKDSDGNAITDVVLTAGNEYRYTITVNLTSLEVTSAISPWTSTTTTGNATMD